MPFTALEMPAIGLMQLRARLEETFGGRVRVDVLYVNHDFAHYLGLKAHAMMMDGMEHHNTGLRDWFFRQAAFPHLEDNTEDYFRRYYPQLRNDQMYKLFIREKRRGLDAFLGEMIRKYELDRADLVGFTSMFSQNVPSLALARKLKERNPSAPVVMGGANCESPMGQEIVKHIDFVDFVFSGPALLSFPEFVGYQMAGEPEKCHRVNGVFSRANVEAPAPMATLGDFRPHKIIGDELDIDTHVPLDYGPFLDDLERSFPNREVSPVLLFETSRGCWWGEKAHCTFCGLNGESMNYRAMRPELARRVFQDLFQYAGRTTHLSCVDNIMPKSYVREVFSDLNTPPDVSIFYEVKADLSEEDMRVLARARVNKIQPGIEALNTSTLKLMRKGTSVFQNLALLKNCALYGITPSWNLLVGFPGEGAEVYEKYVRDLPLLPHLPPPDGAFPVRFDRYSPYFVKAREYDLDLRPVDYYALTYPFAPESLEKLAYYFMDHNLNAKYSTTMMSWIGRVREKREEWARRWHAADGKALPKLYVRKREKTTVVYDSRGGEVTEHHLNDAATQVLDFMQSKPKTVSEIAKGLGHVPGLDAGQQVAGLQRRGLVFQERNQYLSLVLPREPALRPPE
jgi:magnesium-protoporphyrin IX monomethyl ester (oxidative) cyclase